MAALGGHVLDRVFLDANVLYSAAYLENSGLAKLANLENVQLQASAYAIEEARRNLVRDRPKALPRLQRFLASVTEVEVRDLRLPTTIKLHQKDAPILLAAIGSKADYLLTGDARHFGHLYGKRIEGVLVLRPADYFRMRG